MAYTEVLTEDLYRMRSIPGTHEILNRPQEGFLWFLGPPLRDLWVYVGFTTDENQGQHARDGLFADNSGDKVNQSIEERGRPWEVIEVDPQQSIALAEEFASEKLLLAEDSKGNVHDYSFLLEAEGKGFDTKQFVLNRKELEARIKEFLEDSEEVDPIPWNNFCDNIKDHVREVLENEEDPEGDVIPQAFIENKGRVMQLGIDPDFMSDNDGKQKLIRECLLPAVNIMEARKFGLVFHAYRLPPWVAYEGGSLNDYPDRIELLIVMVCDAEIRKLWAAEIERDGVTSPNLEEWEEWEDVNLGNRFIDPIQEAMR